jgi:hypothetical protein
MSCPPNKKLRTPSGVSDINKQNTGWRARMVWIKSIPQEVTPWQPQDLTPSEKR